jgi:hypothetical protein
VTLTAEDAQGNVGSCSFELTVESVLGTGNTSQELTSIILYPIPTENVLNVTNPQGLSLEKVDIFDQRGRLVHTETLLGMGATKPIDIHHLASATYFVKIVGQGGTMIKRLIKK